MRDLLQGEAEVGEGYYPMDLVELIRGVVEITRGFIHMGWFE